MSLFGTPVTAATPQRVSPGPYLGRFRIRVAMGRGVWRMLERWCKIARLSGRGSAW